MYLDILVVDIFDVRRQALPLIGVIVWFSLFGALVVSAFSIDNDM